MQVTRLFTAVLVSLFLSATADSLTAQTITHVPLYTFNGDGNFGWSVSAAGDVNGDGTPDMIVGAPFGSVSGSARVLSGSDGSVLYNFNGDNVTFDRFGWSVSGAGDVNGDGTPDMIVGDPNASARVLSGSDGSVLHNFNGGSHANSAFGWSVSGAGDVNGDGRADLIVGDRFEDDSRSGSAHVFSGIDGSVLYKFDGDESDWLGESVSGAGDVNGDGMADLIVGVRRDDTINGLRTGSARVLSGSDGSVLYTFIGDSAGDEFGYSVSGAGDVNGDGIDDFIVGTLSGGANNGGYARVLSGSDGSILHTFNGNSAGDRFGWSVSGAGDVNGDGNADLIVGAGGFLDDHSDNFGSTRVFSGSDGRVLYNFDGDNANDRLGYSVSGTGDINGDGIDDFIVGTSAGYARVFVSQIVNHDQLLTNGDFEQAPILGVGQTDVDTGSLKSIATESTDANFGFRISGIQSWQYSTPLRGGIASDHGLAKVNDQFGLDPAGQGAFINNWGRRMSQTVMIPLVANDVVTASINFGTLGSPVDGGRAGRFLLVAGEADPNNPDLLSSRSIILDEVSVANPTWSSYTPDLVVDNNQYTQLELEYRFQFDDAALGLPLTIAFSTEGGSAGPTYWDDATLKLLPFLPGDCNVDGVVNFLDITSFLSILSASDYLAEADIDQNGAVDFLDIGPFIAILSGQ